MNMKGGAAALLWYEENREKNEDAISM